MAIRSGLGGQVGYKAETTYGTYIVPTNFLEGGTTLHDTSTFVQGGGVAAGRFQRLGSRRVKTAYGAEGSLNLEVANKGMGALLQTLMGTTVTPVMQGAGPAYLQTHTMADPFGKSLTIQAGVPDLSASGVVQPHNFLGCKVLSAEFSCNLGEMLTSTWEIIGRELETTTALATASYPSGLAPFNFTQMAVKIGATVGGAAAVQGVRGATVKVDRASRTDRLYAGNAGKMSEPIINDWQEITGSFDVDYIDKTVFEDRFHAGTAFALVFEFIGPLLNATFYETFRITLPQCFFAGDTAQLEGPDIVSGQFTFSSGYDGTTQNKIEYISTDITL